MKSKTLKVTIRKNRLFFIFIPIYLVNTFGVNAQQKDWPEFYGPNRNSISSETGLLKSWPASGPKLIWSALGCGKGYSTVSISKGKIFTAGNFDRQTFVLAFDLNGKLLWKSLNMEENQTISEMEKWAERFHGVKSTPTIYDGMVYHLNEMGRLAAFDSKTGKEIWAVNIKTRFEGVWPPCGYSESVLIDEDNVYCQPGGTKGYLAALDRFTGETIWANTEITDSLASYVSSILVEDHGIRQMITLTPYAAVSVNPENGKLLWRIPHMNKDRENIETPFYYNGFVGISSGYGKGFDGIKLTFGDNKISAEKIWSRKKADNLHGGLILKDGYIYGVSCIGSRWFCLDMKTGEEKFRAKGVGLGSLIYADNHLYCLGHNGKMGLAKISPDAFNLISEFQLPEDGQGKWYTHPVVCGGRLYLRHGDYLYAYDIKYKK